MTTKALFVKLEAKAGKEDEVAKFLRDGQGLVQQEPATTAWFGIRLGPTTFAIFDAFPDDAGRDAHLSGKSCQGADGESARATGGAAEDREGRRIGRQVTGLIGLNIIGKCTNATYHRPLGCTRRAAEIAKAFFGLSPLAAMPRFATRRAARHQPSRFSARRFLSCA